MIHYKSITGGLNSSNIPEADMLIAMDLYVPSFINPQSISRLFEMSRHPVEENGSLFIRVPFVPENKYVFAFIHYLDTSDERSSSIFDIRDNNQERITAYQAYRSF